MLDAKVVRQRLAFIRYLHRLAVEQSEQPEPQQAASILTFHDAVELFLHLAFEHSGLGGTTTGFMDYWDRLAHATTPILLSGKASMDRLNRARVSLKHYGLHPSPADVGGFRASVTSFLEDNCQPAFGISFDELSMVDLVTSADVRQRLQEAERAMAQNDFKRAAEHLAIAFDVLLREHDVIGDLLSHRPAFWNLPNTSSYDFFDEQQKLWVSETVATLVSGVRVLALRLDYPRLRRFRQLVPSVQRNDSGNYVVKEHPTKPPTKEQCEKCIEFIVDCALRVQQ